MTIRLRIREAVDITTAVGHERLIRDFWLSELRLSAIKSSLILSNYLKTFFILFLALADKDPGLYESGYLVVGAIGILPGVRMTSFSAMYFPTTTIFIDDEISFLNRVTAAIDSDHHNICQDFGTAETYIKHVPQVHSMRDINALACNPKKHEFVSTIVVDYQMAPKNGLELCKTIKDSPTSKIMLTGIASKNKAIEAHNAELIDFFISKNDPQFLKKLNDAIVMGTRKYFARLSKRISGFYSSNNPLGNPIVAVHLEKELKEAVSYHTWIDFNRLTAVLKSKKQVDYMISSEEDYIALLDSEEAYDAPAEVIKMLKDRTSLLWYEHSLPPGKEWKSHISSCVKIDNCNFYLAKGSFWKLSPE